jgi:hypothetical protein
MNGMHAEGRGPFVSKLLPLPDWPSVAPVLDGACERRSRGLASTIDSMAIRMCLK